MSVLNSFKTELFDPAFPLLFHLESRIQSICPNHPKYNLRSQSRIRAHFCANLSSRVAIKSRLLLSSKESNTVFWRNPRSQKYPLTLCIIFF